MYRIHVESHVSHKCMAWWIFTTLTHSRPAHDQAASPLCSLPAACRKSPGENYRACALCVWLLPPNSTLLIWPVRPFHRRESNGVCRLRMFSWAMASVGFECPLEILTVSAVWPRDCTAWGKGEVGHLDQSQMLLVWDSIHSYCIIKYYTKIFTFTSGIWEVLSLLHCPLTSLTTLIPGCGWFLYVLGERSAVCWGAGGQRQLAHVFSRCY